METFSALLALCARNSPVTGEFPSQRPVTRSCDVFFDLRLNKRFSKQSWGWCFETPSRSHWCHCNVMTILENNMLHAPSSPVCVITSLVMRETKWAQMVLFFCVVISSPHEVCPPTYVGRTHAGVQGCVDNSICPENRYDLWHINVLISMENPLKSGHLMCHKPCIFLFGYWRTPEADIDVQWLKPVSLFQWVWSLVLPLSWMWSDKR